MPLHAEHLRLGWFACEFGEQERYPESIADFEAICSAKGLSPNLASMGCGTFWQMTRPLEEYVAKCVTTTISSRGVAPDAIDHIVFATSDSRLRHLDQDFAKTILERVGLVNCVPTLISMQQCASSLTALDHACGLFSHPNVNHVLLVAFDFVVEDADRIQPFALFGDAVTSCMVSRGIGGTFALLSYGCGVDFAGFLGQDSFESRKRVAVTTLETALGQSNTRLVDIEKCFSTNFYKPMALFYSLICGIGRDQLCIATLPRRAHCGNCDWMINLMHYQTESGLVAGKRYLIQSFAPGFFACGLLEAAPS